MFNSSNQYGYAAIATPDYMEYAWVCAPNAAGQSITANTITTLTIDTEISDTGNHGSVSSNQVTLSSGTYYFELTVPVRDTNNASHAGIIGLYNVSDSVWISRNGTGAYTYTGNTSKVVGQFTISSSKILDCRILLGASGGNFYIDNGTGTAVFTDSTAGTDQRTTLKLWRSKDTFNTGTLYVGGGGGGYTSYAEYAWVCAPNAAGQSISANTITTLTIDTEVSDVDNIGTISSNQITLVTGTYYFETEIVLGYNGSSYPDDSVFSLYNVSDSYYVSKTRATGASYGGNFVRLNGQFTITTSKIFDLRIVCAAAGLVGTRIGNGTTLTLATAGADQRTTIKLWKK